MASFIFTNGFASKGKIKMKKVIWLVNEKKGNDYSLAIIFWYGILENMGYEVMYHDYQEYLEKGIDDFYARAKAFNPDFIIVGAYDKLHTELVRVREFTKLYVLQSDDRWRYANFGKYWIPFIDGVITFEGDEKPYMEDGLSPDNFCKMRWSFNPNTMCLGEIERDILVSHTGGMHGERTKRLQDLKAKGIDVGVFQSAYYEETKQAWASSYFSLCYTMNSLNTGRELKGRVIEIPNFCVLLTEPFPDMEEYYDMDTECVLFNSDEEMIAKMEHLSKNSVEYNKVFHAGRRALWNRNTVYHEWNKILHKIDPDYEPIDVIKLLKERHGDFYVE